MTRRGAPQGGALATDPTKGDRRQHTCSGYRWRGTAYGRAALASEVDAILAAPKGTRHHVGSHAGRAIGELVGAGELDRDYAESALVRAAKRADVKDARHLIVGNLEYGMSNPRIIERARGARVASATDARITTAEWLDALDATGTTRRIAVAIGRACFEIGKVEIALSYREVADRAGISVGTVAKHRARLAGWVRVTHRGSRFRTDDRTVWRLVTGSRRVAPGNTPEAISCREGRMFPHATHADPALELWNRRPAAWSVWCALYVDEPTTASQLARMAAVHRSTASRVLSFLEAKNLARRAATGWVRTDRPVTRFELPDIRRAEKRRDERDDFARRLTRWRAERDAAREDFRSVS